MIKFQIIIEKKGFKKTIKPFLSRTASTLALIFSIVVLSTLIGLGIHLVLAQTNPTQPPPQGNVPGPINVSGVTQTKEGKLFLRATSQDSPDTPEFDERWELTESGTIAAKTLTIYGNAGANEVRAWTTLKVDNKIEAPNQGWEDYVLTSGGGGSDPYSYDSSLYCPDGWFLSYVRAKTNNQGKIWLTGSCYAPFKKTTSPPSGPGGGEPPGCFIAGTKVVTPSGLRPIESIKEGDKVLSFDTETSKTVVSTVVKLKGKITEDLLKLGFSNGIVLSVTSEHRFFDPLSKNYRPIKTFKQGDKVLLVKENGQTEIVTLFTIEPFSQSETRVYNFEVDNPLHNYLVEGILVHNRKCAEGVCEAFCGDGICNGWETCSTCPADCQAPWDCEYVK